MTKSKKKFKVGIFGAAVEANKSTLKYAKELGRLLAEKGCEIVTGMAMGISHEVLLEAKKYGAKTKGFSPDVNSKDHKERFDNADLNDFDSVVFSKGFTRRSLNLIEYCDAVIVLGGRMGTLSEYTISFEEEKPIGVLSVSGGIAQHLGKITKICNKHRSVPIFFCKNPKNLLKNILNYLTHHKEKYFGENSKLYYKLDQGSQQLKINTEKTMINKIKKEKFRSILEIGSGDGHFLKNFLDKKILGIEISDHMIKNSGKMRNYLIKENIANECLLERFKQKYDIVASNYVFTELNKKQLRIAFRNIYNILNKKGSFFFTITNPKTRHLDFEFHKLKFSKPFSYKKEDLPFKVLLKNSIGKFVDTGIRDFHNPLETYELLLKQAGFKKIKRYETKESENKPSHAIIYVCKK